MQKKVQIIISPQCPALFRFFVYQLEVVVLLASCLMSIVSFYVEFILL